VNLRALARHSQNRVSLAGIGSGHPHPHFDFFCDAVPIHAAVSAARRLHDNYLPVYRRSSTANPISGDPRRGSQADRLRHGAAL